ncbi:MAG: helix-turn-helix domain-containing protein [Planctomycetes bacterium]|nr:helix-turn-helix domain-containing protein [Planctomycetota bacterium]
MADRTPTKSKRTALAAGDMLTFPEITAALGVSRSLLRRWLSDGKFPGADLCIGGNVRRWWPGTVERFIKRNKA